MDKPLPDVAAPGLLNPRAGAAAPGHHFVGRSNRALTTAYRELRLSAADGFADEA